MRAKYSVVTGVSLAYLSLVAAAPQQLDFNQITAALTVANGPTDNGFGDQIASLYTTFASPTAVTAAATAAVKARDIHIAKRKLVYSNSQIVTSSGAGCGQASYNSTFSSGVL